ncbi:Nn.00g087080.m01.CDS01 [Neocucurbitaria sp. VM-36]
MGCGAEHATAECSVDVTLTKLMDLLKAEIIQHKPATEDTPTLLKEILQNNDTAMEEKEMTVENGHQQVLHGGRLVSTFTMADMGELRYSSDIEYHTRSSNGDDYEELDITLLERLRDVTHKELDCLVCYNLMLDPTTTTCGHTFCRRCLARVMDHSSICPFCRRGLHVPASLQNQSSNIILNSLLNALCPDLVTTRATALKAEEQAGDNLLNTPLFICTLSLPSMPTFLHVFEPRYRLMMRRVIEGNRQFGMVMYNRTHAPQGDLGATQFLEYGTLLEIVNYEILRDGRSFIETRGIGRFKVKAHGMLDGYDVSRIERVEDVSLAEEGVQEQRETTMARDYAEAFFRANPQTQLPTNVALETLSTQQLLDACTAFVREMREASAPWLRERIIQVYGEPPVDPATFPYWFASVVPIVEEENESNFHFLTKDTMEALSGAASGIAVVSLSIQLVQSVGTIKTFIRNVKDAPKEFERLVELLERLSALLEDVCAVLERQSSLQGQHFPAPSMTIFKCLQGCEKTLQPLQNIVEKFDNSQPHTASVIARFKNEVKLGLKAKDIAGFEMRIEQEINYLHAALGMNSTAILVNFLPALLRTQETTTTTHLQPLQAITSSRGSTMVASKCDGSLVTASTELDITRRTFLVHSSLQKFGLYHWKSIRAIRHGRMEKEQYSGDHSEIIYEENRFTWLCTYLGFGVQWNQQSSSILPSLSVYPVVDDFDYEVNELMYSGSVVAIQQLFSSGRLHPFVRDKYGYSLLHLAALYARPDICRLLLDYGLRPDLTNSGDIPFTLMILPNSDNATRTIDTLRLIFPSHAWLDIVPGISRLLGMDLDVVEWLWVNSREFYFETLPLSLLRSRLVNAMIYHYSSAWLYSKELVTRQVVTMMDPDKLDFISEESHTFLPQLFCFQDNPLRSFEVGNAFINLLSLLGLDIQTFMAKELKSWPSSSNHQDSYDYRKRIIFERSCNGGWLLGWNWIHDPQAPGYLVVSEFSVLGGRDWYYNGDVGVGLKYPWMSSLISTTRFNRRMATQARKERARTGQKRPKRRMPGAWN